MAGIRLGGEERPAVGTEPARGAATGIYSGEVEVEVGPLNDFSQLTAIEDAAAAIEGVSQVMIRLFSGGRATLALHLSQPIELLRELEQRAPFKFSVRDARGDGVVLDVADAGERRAA
jgi:hypothetical protein